MTDNEIKVTVNFDEENSVNCPLCDEGYTFLSTPSKPETEYKICDGVDGCGEAFVIEWIGGG